MSRVKWGFHSCGVLKAWRSYFFETLTSSTLCSKPCRGGVAVDVVDDMAAAVVACGYVCAESAFGYLQQIVRSRIVPLTPTKGRGFAVMNGVRICGDVGKKKVRRELC